MSEASANAFSDNRPASVQLQPPISIRGRSADDSSATTSATVAASGAGSVMRAGPCKGAASVRLVSMSSGSAITTGPGRPVVAVTQARARISGMRPTSSISVESFVSGRDCVNSTWSNPCLDIMRLIKSMRCTSSRLFSLAPASRRESSSRSTTVRSKRLTCEARMSIASLLRSENSSRFETSTSTAAPSAVTGERSS